MTGDRGSASLWVLSAAMLVGLTAGAAVLRESAVVLRHRAETAADLAALAAAARIGVDDQSCEAAERIATANGTRLLTCDLATGADGRSGQVTVVVAADIHLFGERSVTASARAGRATSSQTPPTAPGAGPG